MPRRGTLRPGDWTPPRRRCSLLIQSLASSWLRSTRSALPGRSDEEDALRNALMASNVRAVLVLGEPVREIALNANGDLIGAVGADGLARLWHVLAPRVLIERHVGEDGGIPFTHRRTIVIHGSEGPPVEIDADGNVVCTFGTVPVADAAVAGRLVVLSTGDRFESGT